MLSSLPDGALLVAISASDPLLAWPERAETSPSKLVRDPPVREVAASVSKAVCPRVPQV
jgi:hypothetical protein